MAALLALFLRSLRDDMRSRALFWARTVLALAVVFAIIKTRSLRFFGGAAGLDFFGTLVWMNFVCIIVAGLSYFASAITEEKEEGTLGLLRMTDLSPLAILLGKSTTRLIGGLLLLLVQVPFALLAVTLGGITIWQVVGSYALLAAFLFLTCNCALLGSVLAKRTGGAAVWSAIIGGLWLGAMLPAYGEIARMDKDAYLLPEVLDDLLGTMGAQLSIAGMLTSLIIGGVIFFLLAWLFFDRFCTEAAGVPRKSAAALSLRRENLGRATRDPIAWKDFHFIHGGPRVMVIKGVIYFAASMWYFVETFGRNRGWSGAWKLEAMLYAFCAFVVVMAETLFAASRIFRLEARAQTFGSLAILPLDMPDIIRAKRRAVFTSLIPAFIFLGIVSPLVMGIMLEAFGSSSGGKVLFYTIQFLGWFIAQFYFNIRLVAWFSLRMKWGGLPLALGVSFLANSIGSFLAVLIFREAAGIILIVAIAITAARLKYALAARLTQAAEE